MEKNKKTMTNEEMAEYLGKTLASVRVLASKLKVRKEPFKKNGRTYYRHIWDPNKIEEAKKRSKLRKFRI